MAGTSDDIRLPIVLNKHGFDETIYLTQKQRKAAEYYILKNLPKWKARVQAGYTDYTKSGSTSKDPMNLNYVKANEIFKTQDMITYVDYLLAKKNDNIDLSSDNLIKQIGLILAANVSDLYDLDGKPLPPHKLPEHVKKAVKSVKPVILRLDDGTEEMSWEYQLNDFNATMRSYGLMRDYEPQRFNANVKQREVKLMR